MDRRCTFISLFFLILWWPFTAYAHAEGHSYDVEKVSSAVAYLTGHYNATVGLIYESEETGEHFLGSWAKFNSTYWLYSDNLFAYHALNSFAPYIGGQIGSVYGNNYSFPKDTLLFGVLFGEDIPDQIHNTVNVVIVNETDRVVVYDRHEGPTVLNHSLFADLLCYKALDEFQRGTRAKALEYLEEASRMWDGNGFYDEATKDDGYYYNFKLGLFLYASWFMSVETSIEASVEAKLWACQGENGGIVSLCNMAGEPIGSCNAETTALGLLPYTIVPVLNPAEAWYSDPVSFAIVALMVMGIGVSYLLKLMLHLRKSGKCLL